MDEQARMYKYNFLPQRTSLIPPPNTRNMKKRLKLLSCKALSPRGPSCRCLSRAPTDNTISLERTWGRTFSPSAAIQHQMIDSNASLILAKIFTSLKVGKKRYLGHLSKMICLIYEFTTLSSTVRVPRVWTRSFILQTTREKGQT